MNAKDWMDLMLLPLCFSVVGVLLSRRCLHYFQLESYQFRGYFSTLRRQAKKVWRPLLALAAAEAALCLLCMWIPWAWAHAVLGLGFGCAGLLLYRSRVKRQPKEKKPLRITARVKRLIAAFSAVVIAAHLGMAALTTFFPPLQALTALLLPLLLALGAVIALPAEKAVYEYYFRSARRLLLAQKDLIRIGVTGSFGKTSVKFILLTLLSEKYRVLSTPGSFNTPMGLSKVIRSDLNAGHQVFIAEMGARHRKDIRELCRLVHPQIGLLTAVGAQHLDTFGSLEAIRDTKYDLIRSLPDDGTAFFLDDQDIVRGLYAQTHHVTSFLAGSPDGDAWADHVTLSEKGSSFDLYFKGEQEPVHCVTSLLGPNSIRNIVLCALTARRLGLTDRQIRRGIERLQPVEHRMQLLPSSGGVTVIDDSFNSNPVSSGRALETLKAFNGRRIIVTPGMVELGKDEDRYNREFGEHMASCCDLAILVGRKHTVPIQEGLRAQGFPEENIRVFSRLSEAVAHLNQQVQSGDVVMYENDLPDHYDD